MANVDKTVVADFGDEWARFDQNSVHIGELQRIFDQYFSLFPWNELAPDAAGFDLGCGTGRWAYFVASRVRMLHCVDPAAAALDVARRKLVSQANCQFYEAAVDEIPLEDASMDFGYSLGVLHHVPDTRAGIAACVRKLRPGAPFLLYLYYAFDNRPWWFKAIWKVTDLLRRMTSILPHRLRSIVTDAIAVLAYWPLARGTALLEKAGVSVAAFPLSAYRDKSFYTMRTDARDRFGTRLEQRFTRDEISAMMTAAGLERIQFRDGAPFWCAIGYRRKA